MTIVEGVAANKAERGETGQKSGYCRQYVTALAGQAAPR